MATAAVLTERAESLGLPITKNAFEGTLENPVPPLPYMVYLLPREATAGADSRPNNLMADDWQLELYTVADDEAAEEIRTRIENEVLHDVTMLNLWLMWIVMNVFKRHTKSRDY